MVALPEHSSATRLAETGTTWASSTSAAMSQGTGRAANVPGRPSRVLAYLLHDPVELGEPSSPDWHDDAGTPPEPPPAT
jgi:hypothetical protein